MGNQQARHQAGVDDAVVGVGRAAYRERGAIGHEYRLHAVIAAA